MMNQRINPDTLLQAWADALNAVADLQQAIVEVAETESMNEDQLRPFRAVVFGTLKTFPDRAKERAEDSLQAAQDLKNAATGQLELLRERAKGETLKS